MMRRFLFVTNCSQSQNSCNIEKLELDDYSPLRTMESETKRDHGVGVNSDLDNDIDRKISVNANASVLVASGAESQLERLGLFLPPATCNDEQSKYPTAQQLQHHNENQPQSYQHQHQSTRHLIPSEYQPKINNLFAKYGGKTPLAPESHVCGYSANTASKEALWDKTERAPSNSGFDINKKIADATLER